jgi:glutamine cyclotransferase
MRLTVLFLASLYCFSIQGSKKLELIRKIPHSGYSEGLDFYDGFLWHALPKEILKIDPKEGSILKRFTPASDYSESLVWFLGDLWNVSFSNNNLYRGKLSNQKLSFKKVSTVPEVHAWGMAHDNKNIILTGDYSDKLYFIDPKTFKTTKTLSVKTKEGTPVSALEDLAYDKEGFIWTSSFTTYRGQIFKINPKGIVEEFYDLTDKEDCPIIDGIAYDGNLYVTGKNCPSIYYFKYPK